MRYDNAITEICGMHRANQKNEMKNSVCRDIRLGLPDRDAKVDCVMEEEDGEFQAREEHLCSMLQ